MTAPSKKKSPRVIKAPEKKLAPRLNAGNACRIRLLTGGSFRGALSDKKYTFQTNEVIEIRDGDAAHLDAEDFEIVSSDTPLGTPPPPAPRYKGRKWKMPKALNDPSTF